MESGDFYFLSHKIEHNRTGIDAKLSSKTHDFFSFLQPFCTILA